MEVKELLESGKMYNEHVLRWHTNWCVLPLDVSITMHRQRDYEDPESRNRDLAQLVFILTNGIPPYHFACMHPCTTWYPFRMDTLQSLSTVVPEEERMDFYHGKLPFHYACHAGAPRSVLKWCEMHYPDALCTSTTDTADTPMHCYLLSWSSNHATLATGNPNMTTIPTTPSHWIQTKHKMPSLLTVQYLIEKHRAALHSHNRHGYLPLHIAAMSDVPLDIIFYLTREFPETVVTNEKDLQ